MYVKEMHIEVATATQKIASNKTRKLLPDEIDWLLNKNLQRFIQLRVSPKKDGSGGYELNSFDSDAIRTLMATGVEIPAYVADPRRYRSCLPGDYSYLISDESVIKRPNLGDQVLTTQMTANLLVLPIFKSILSQAPYYTSVTVTINNGVAFDIGQYTQARNTTYTGYTSPDQVYEVSQCILRALIDAGWQAYWETYGSVYVPRSIIISVPAPATGSVTIDGATTPGTSQTKQLIANDLPGQPTEDNTNRLTASNILQNLREVAFYKTQPESPLSELAGNELLVYANNSFIVTNTRLSYVRKPRRISLTLGQDCELAPDYHQLVCDMTVEYYKALIADPNWETKLKDNMVRTQL